MSACITPPIVHSQIVKLYIHVQESNNKFGSQGMELEAF